MAGSIPSSLVYVDLSGGYSTSTDTKTVKILPLQEILILGTQTVRDHAH